MERDFEREKEEAIMAGRKAWTSLRAAQAELNKAQGWGLFDLFGGGVITTLIKRDKMNNAKRYIEEARYDLRCFNKELRDVDDQLDLNIQTDDFLEFADFVFDNFFTDILVQDKINKAKGQVDEAIYRVEAILDRLMGYTY